MRRPPPLLAPAALLLAGMVAVGTRGTEGPKGPAEVPPALGSLLERKYPGSRVLVPGDLPPDSPESFYEGSRPDSPGVACADFDGDGRRDYALLLVLGAGAENRLVVAFAKAKGWELEEVWRGGSGEGAGERYLVVLPKGAYESVGPEEALGPGGEGFARDYESPRPGFYFGRYDTEGAAYFRNRKLWIRLRF